MTFCERVLKLAHFFMGNIVSTPPGCYRQVVHTPLVGDHKVYLERTEIPHNQVPHKGPDVRMSVCVCVCMCMWQTVCTGSVITLVIRSFGKF